MQAYNSQATSLSATTKRPRIFRLSFGHEEVDEQTRNYLRSINLPFLTWFWFDELGTVAIQTNRVSDATQNNQVIMNVKEICVCVVGHLSNQRRLDSHKPTSYFARYCWQKISGLQILTKCDMENF